MRRRRRLCILGDCTLNGAQPLVTRSLRYHAIENEDSLSCGSSESPDIELEPKIYEAAVIVIINSIINADGNSLKHLQLPQSGVVWDGDPIMYQFLHRLNRFVENIVDWNSYWDQLFEVLNREDGPSVMDFVMNMFYARPPWIIQDRNHLAYGLQSFTCNKCNHHSCVGNNKRSLWYYQFRNIRDHVHYFQPLPSKLPSWPLPHNISGVLESCAK